MSGQHMEKKHTSRRHGPGMGGPGHPPEKAKDFKGTLRKLLRYMKAYKAGIFVVIFFAILSTVFHVIGPKVLILATTELFTGLVAQIPWFPLPLWEA